MSNIQKVLDQIPEYDHFLTVEELDAELRQLAKEYPDKVEVFEAGRSRKGHPILCAKIGNGSRNALMFGCPHPNEPIGAMTARYFSRAITENDALREELDLTWYIIPVSDVDGTKLNEGWFKGPFTLYNYTRNYFRPAGYEQVEWTFPISYKKYTFDEPIPETQALMKIIDEINPVLLYSLHNSGFGGAYWYISKDTPEVYDAFHKAANDRNIPIDLGEPEVPYAVPFGPAIYKMLTSADSYDYYENFTDKNPEECMSAGASSAEYSGENCTTLVAEVPYFYEARVDSDKVLDMTREEAVITKLDFYSAEQDELKKHYDVVSSYFGDDNPFIKMVRQGIDYMPRSLEAERSFVKNNPDFQKKCKESEALSNLDIPKFGTLFSWSLFIRGMEYDLKNTNCPDAKAAFEKEIAICEEILKDRADAAEKALNYEVIPIQTLVYIQLASGLAVAEALSKKK